MSGNEKHLSWGMAGVMLVVMIGGMLAFKSCSQGTNKALDRAATNCRQWIREQAKNPSSAEIPRPGRLLESDIGFKIAWEHGDGLILTNDFGARVDTAAHCIMSPDGNFLKELVIDGHVIRRQ